LDRRKVLDELTQVTFTGLRWQDELIRSKVPSDKNETSILPILANAITALRLAPEWQGVLAYDEFRCNVVAVKPVPWGALPKNGWTDQEDRLTAEWLQRNRIFVSVEIASQAVQTIAAQRRVHPIRDYLNNLQWDGVSPLDQWLTTYLGVEESNYSYAVGARWMLSAIAQINRPGAKADCCLILEGPQGIKKSTALRTLAAEYFTDELADLGSKDAALQIRGVWITVRAGPCCSHLFGDFGRPAAKPDNSLPNRRRDAGDVRDAQRGDGVSSARRCIRTDLRGDDLLWNRYPRRSSEGRPTVAVQLLP
jgi:virulence-associated protein E